MRRLQKNITQHLLKKQLNQKQVFAFGGTPAGEIRPEDVHFNTASFVSNQNNNLVSLNGFEDVNVKSYPDDTDPYHHLREASFFSFERLYFSDPYYHADEHERCMNEPHGYVTMDDPMDVRNNVERSYMEYIFYFSAALILGFTLGFQGLMMKGHSQELFDVEITADMLEQKLREIRIQNEALESRKQQLLDQLNE